MSSNSLESKKIDEKKLSRKLLLRTVLTIAIVAVILLLVTGWIMDKRLYSQRQESMFRELKVVRSMIESIMLDELEGKLYRVHQMLDQFLEELHAALDLEIDRIDLIRGHLPEIVAYRFEERVAKLEDP